jgi:membrane carboxypeptidase/penicillin-binding protein
MTPAPAPTRVVDPAVAYLVTSALEGVIERGTGRALSALGHDGAIAGKTGTSNNGRDAWFIAYSKSLVVGVWVGYDDSRDLHMTGATAALPIVSRFLAEATTEDDWQEFPVPDGVTVANVGATMGDSDSECGSREYFLAGTAPRDDGCSDFRLPDAIEWGARSGRDAGREVLRFLAKQLRALRGISQ